MHNAAIESLFPNLRGTAYQIVSPETARYNCIAWAAGDDTRWWDPTPSYYWPAEPRDLSVESFKGLFSSLGYTECEDPEPEAESDKIAVYAKESLLCHIARQLPSGQWTSKCGRSFDIMHTLEGLEGEEYGRVVLIMKRPKPIQS